MEFPLNQHTFPSALRLALTRSGTLIVPDMLSWFLYVDSHTGCLIVDDNRLPRCL